MFPWPQWESCLKEMAALGRSSTEIARHLAMESGIDLDAAVVRKKAMRMGIHFVRAEKPKPVKRMGGEKPPRFWDQWEGQLRQMVAKSLSAGDISLELSRQAGRTVSRNAVIGKCNQLKLKLGGQSGKPSKKRKAAKPRKHGRLASVTAGGFGAAPIAALDPEAVERFPTEPLPESIPVSIVDLNYFTQCKWPLKEADVIGGYLFCGAKQIEGCSYCQRHWDRAHGHGTRSERKAA